MEKIRDELKLLKANVRNLEAIADPDYLITLERKNPEFRLKLRIDELRQQIDNAKNCILGMELALKELSERKT